MCCLIVVGVVLCLDHRGLGGLGGASVWRRVGVGDVVLLVRVCIGVEVCRRGVLTFFGGRVWLRWGVGVVWHLLRCFGRKHVGFGIGVR